MNCFSSFRYLFRCRHLFRCLCYETSRNRALFDYTILILTFPTGYGLSITDSRTLLEQNSEVITIKNIVNARTRSLQRYVKITAAWHSVCRVIRSTLRWGKTVKSVYGMVHQLTGAPRWNSSNFCGADSGNQILQYPCPIGLAEEKKLVEACTAPGRLIE